MRNLIVLAFFTLSSYSTLWYGQNKLDLWHESTVPVYKNIGMGTEFVASFSDASNPTVVYGYLFGYYRVNNNIRVMIGKDYYGAAVIGTSFNWKIGT